MFRISSTYDDMCSYVANRRPTQFSADIFLVVYFIAPPKKRFVLNDFMKSFYHYIGSFNFTSRRGAYMYIYAYISAYFQTFDVFFAF